MNQRPNQERSGAPKRTHQQFTLRNNTRWYRLHRSWLPFRGFLQWKAVHLGPQVGHHNCWSKNDSSHFKRNKKQLILETFWVTMVLQNSLFQWGSSFTEHVYFYRTKKVINEAKFKMHGYMHKMGELLSSSKCYLMTFLDLKLVEAIFC